MISSKITVTHMLNVEAKHMSSYNTIYSVVLVKIFFLGPYLKKHAKFECVSNLDTKFSSSPKTMHDLAFLTFIPRGFIFVESVYMCACNVVV